MKIATALILILLTGHVSEAHATTLCDQGQIFGTGGGLQLGTDQWSQSITTGIAGPLSGIQIQFHRGLPEPVPPLTLSIFAGGNPTTGPELFSEQLFLTSADLEVPDLFTWDLSSADLLFDVGDDFSFGLQAEQDGLEIAGNEPPGYDDGELFKNQVASSGLSDIAFITIVASEVSDYSFGDWANDRGYSPGAVMPSSVEAGDRHTRCGSHGLGINSLSGIGEFDWTTTPTRYLSLYSHQLTSIESGDFDGLTNLETLDLEKNQLSSIESGDFSGLVNLQHLELGGNQISSIEAGVFSGLTNLRSLDLGDNTPLTALNLDEADFSNLENFHVFGNDNIVSVSLKNAVLNQNSLESLLSPCTPIEWFCTIGIGGLDGIAEMDLSGVDFGNITDLSPLYQMDSLTDLWLRNAQNMDASDLDVLLDNLWTIEGTDTEGVLYMTQADFDAFNTAGGGLLDAWNEEPGHHVEFVISSDLNVDGSVDGLDLGILLGNFDQNDIAASGGELNGTDPVDGLDLGILLGAWNPPPLPSASSVPEPSTLILSGLAAIGVFARCGRCFV